MNFKYTISINKNLMDLVLPVLLIVGAIIIAACNGDGWGWFLILGLMVFASS